LRASVGLLHNRRRKHNKTCIIEQRNGSGTPNGAPGCESRADPLVNSRPNLKHLVHLEVSAPASRHRYGP
jgi:hypothetical protein